MKELLIVVDMQNDFVTGVLGSAEARAVLPKLKQKIDGARTAGKTIVFTRDTHGADIFRRRRGEICPCLTVSAEQKAGKSSKGFV